LTLGELLSVQDVIDAVRHPFRFEDASFTQSRTVAVVEHDPEAMQHKPKRVAIGFVIDSFFGAQFNESLVQRKAFRSDD
jgi:hypothetical protein